MQKYYWMQSSKIFHWSTHSCYHILNHWLISVLLACNWWFVFLVFPHSAVYTIPRISCYFEVNFTFRSYSTSCIAQFTLHPPPPGYHPSTLQSLFLVEYFWMILVSNSPEGYSLIWANYYNNIQNFMLLPKQSSGSCLISDSWIYRISTFAEILLLIGKGFVWITSLIIQ